MRLARGWAGLLLSCVACMNDPLRAPSFEGGLSCEERAFAVGEEKTESQTLLRFRNRGVEFLRISVTAPRLLEALYDSTGRPLVLASIAEENVSQRSGVGVLAIEFRGSRLAGTWLEIAPDHAGHLNDRELRAYRRFTGPPYMTVVISEDGGLSRVVKREAVPVSSEDEKKARSLAAQLWELRCPRP